MTETEKRELQDKLLNKPRTKGTYERYMDDILKYLRVKFPDSGEDKIMEAAGYISQRTMTVMGDLFWERDKEWRSAMRKLEHDIVERYRRVKEHE